MAFIHRPFDSRVVPDQSIDAKRIVVIACEDQNVQPTYFNYLKEIFDIPTVTELTVLPCIDGKSSILHVCENLNEFVLKQSEIYGFEEKDEFWIVIDREDPEHNIDCEQLSKYLEECCSHTNNFKIGLTNPLFELWLLLHVDDLKNHNLQDLLENKKPNVKAKKRYIDKKLSEILNGFNKKRSSIGKTIEKILTEANLQKAIEQEKALENNPLAMLQNNRLGSNIGTLVQSILTP